MAQGVERSGATETALPDVVRPHLMLTASAAKFIREIGDEPMHTPSVNRP